MELRLGKLSGRIVLVVRSDFYDHGILRLERWRSEQGKGAAGAIVSGASC